MSKPLSVIASSVELDILHKERREIEFRLDFYAQNLTHDGYLGSELRRDLARLEQRLDVLALCLQYHSAKIEDGLDNTTQEIK